MHDSTEDKLLEDLGVLKKRPSKQWQVAELREMYSRLWAEEFLTTDDTMEDEDDEATETTPTSR
jgi:hypothetical protein